ncbi:ATP synthase F0 subunit B [Campylobacter coli]|nr:ATP synthase F0 subunit B [Campylobacter coli]EAJ5713906.1 ATP synthase F0 subunit B [Campylobacter coli]EAJ8946472.1 ATP synthase F0 subunit B [Campylobacter coli]EAK2875252.1 ATP synthase F0 subunit B [Campylobacter coli]EAL2764690.1 hypothetical protein [Campylobacter coli]
MADLEQVVNDLNLASQSLQELREKYDGALDLLDNKNTQITGALDSAKSNALQEIQTISDTATSQISQLKNTSLNLVNEAKNTAIEEVNNAVSGIDTSKEEALLAIEQAKAAQEEKITDLEQAKENIITELSEKAKLLTQSLEWTVGVGGKFTTLKSALIEASKYITISDFFITIKLVSDITENKINIDGLNLKHTSIDFNNFKITGAIYITNSIVRNIAKLNLKKGTTGSQGVYISSAMVRFTDIVTIEGFNDGLNINENSFVTFFNNTSNTTTMASGRFIAAEKGAYINISGLNINMATGFLFSLSRGAVLSNSYQVNFTGGATECNIPKNTVTANGIYFKN